MELIAKVLTLKDCYSLERNPTNQFPCLCINSDEERMNNMVYAYGINKNMFIIHENKEYKVVARISKEANTFDGEKLNFADIAWCDSKALISHSKKEYFPLEKYLFVDELPAWISSSVYVRRTVSRFM